MAHSGGLISAPINTDDVSSVLDVASHDVATLCTSSQINPAALFRPRYSSANPGLQLRGSDGKFLAAANTEIAGNISQRPSATYQCPNLGIWVPEFALRNLTSSNYGTMHSQARNTWFVPVPDKGGVGSFKILDHFDGYDHNASFKDPVLQVSVTKKNTTTNTIQIMFSTPSPVSQPGVISVGNMFGGKGYYFGAVVFRGTNAEGIQQSDTMIVFSSGTAIKSDAATTVTLSKDDTPPNAATTTYYYRIIPFVCNKANITSALDTDFYSIHMSDDYPGIYTMKVGDSATGGGVKDYYFAWTEPANTGNYYPTPDGKQVMITPATYHPDIIATFKARPEGMGTAPLKDMFSRIDFTLSLYVNGKHELHEFTWMKSGGSAGNGVLKRDTQKDNVGGYEDYLFFSIDNATNLLNSVDDPSEIEITADFYYTNGITTDYGLFAIYIPSAT